MKKNPKIVFLGAGAVGASVGGWLAPVYDTVFFLDQGETAEALKFNGITSYIGDAPENKVNTPVKVINDLEEAKDADIIFLGVKNYSLDAISKMIREKFENPPLIVGMQNGIENQSILPKYFKKVVYCVICYNAWLDAPGVVGCQKHGPLVLGTPDNSLQDEMKTIRDILNPGVETVISDHLVDAVHSKMIINLTNSLTTLIGHKFKPITNQSLLQKLLTNLTHEGVQIVKRAGHNECSLGGMPSWKTIWAAAKLPQFITKGIFEKNLAKMVVSSMAQDVIQRKSSDNELESLNGYFLNLARKFNMKVPYNQVIYDLCVREFSKPEFNPMDIEDVWAEVGKAL
ncbi:2-dehydropantoate 2-reductase [bacterium]|nr:2-dehydropantoate 2-reductase [bacterium]